MTKLRALYGCNGTQHALVTDYDKALYFSGYLKDGSPKSWYYTIKNSSLRSHLLHDWEGFLDAFRNHFGDSDRQSSATEEMELLRQTGSCATFASCLRELLVDLDLNESLKIEYFRKRLKDNIQDALALVKWKDVPTDFDEYVELCISIDNSLHRRGREKKTSKPTGNNSSSSAKCSSIFSALPASSHTPAAPPSVSPGIPMEIDATKTTPCAPLSKEERERRRREGLCSYCGGKHGIDNCPNMSERAKKAFAARKASAVSGKV